MPQTIHTLLTQYLLELKKNYGCAHPHIDPYIEYGLTKPHCFVSAERTDPIAKDAFDRMISFLNKKTK